MVMLPLGIFALKTMKLPFDMLPPALGLRDFPTIIRLQCRVLRGVCCSKRIPIDRLIPLYECLFFLLKKGARYLQLLMKLLLLLLFLGLPLLAFLGELHPGSGVMLLQLVTFENFGERLILNHSINLGSNSDLPVREDKIFRVYAQGFG